MHRPLSIIAAALLLPACGPPERANATPWMPSGASGAADDHEDSGDDHGADEPQSGGESDGTSGPGDNAGDDGQPEPSTGDGHDPTGGGSTSAAEPEPESPYVGGWSVGDCQDAVVPGGDVIDDITLLDQYNDSVRLYDFCHLAVLFVGGALWWGGCVDAASGLEATYQSYKDQGLLVIHAWAENQSGATPNQTDLVNVQSQLGSSYIQMSDPGWSAFDHITQANGHPGYALLAPGMRVVKRGSITDADIVAVLPQ